MTDFMRRLMELALAPDIRVEAWSDGSFSTAFELAGALWRIHYVHDNGWITLRAPLLALPDGPDPALLKRLLAANLDLLFMRYAVGDHTVCARGDISEQEFNEDEFRLVSRIAIDVVKHAVEELQLTTPPVEE